MAVVVFNAALVQFSGGGRRSVNWGETVTQGQMVYLNTSDQKYWLGKGNAAGTAKVTGVALTAGAANQPGVIGLPGKNSVLTLGANLATNAGDYVLAINTAGAIQPFADLTSGAHIVYVGPALNSSAMRFDVDDNDTTF